MMNHLFKLDKPDVECGSDQLEVFKAFNMP